VYTNARTIYACAGGRERRPIEEGIISASVETDRPSERGFFATTLKRLGALPVGIFAGATFGALFGGVAGRILMRSIFLIDKIDRWRRDRLRHSG
jgi:hypothetical protein